MLKTALFRGHRLGADAAALSDVVGGGIAGPPVWFWSFSKCARSPLCGAMLWLTH